MAIDKLTPRYLNKDKDERLIKPVEMTDALNVRISTEDDGDGVVIKNAYGNTSKSFNIAPPGGTNTVVGSIAHEQLGIVVFFIHNSNNSHSIYQYSSSTGSSTRVYQDSVLGFTATSHITGDIIEANNGDVLVFFNDRESDPKKINTTKAIAGNYPSKFTTGTDEEKLLFLTVAKQPPLSPPTYNIVNNSALKENRIFNKVYQFAYKYVYEDGEHSALSPYSSLTSSITQLRDGFITESTERFYNQINVFVRNTVADVEKIVVYAREGNTGTFFEIAEKDNVNNNNAVTINFIDDKRGAPLSSTQQNKLYDNVPQKADSQSIVEGRLMYGGYTEGYENVDTTSTLLANYSNKPTRDNFDVAFNGSNLRTIEFDFSDSAFDGTTSEDSRLFINVFWDPKTMNIVNTGGGSLTFSDADFSFIKNDGSAAITSGSGVINAVSNGVYLDAQGIQFRENLDIPSGSSRTDIIDTVYDLYDGTFVEMGFGPTNDGDSIQSLNNNRDGNFVGNILFRLDVTKNANTVDIDIVPVTLVMRPNFISHHGAPLQVLSYEEIEINIQTGKTISNGSALLYKGSNFLGSLKGEGKCFKSGSSHSLGIVYYDDRNRSTGVQELGDVFVNSLNDRTDEDSLYGPASVVMRLDHDPPSFAKKWAPVYVGKGNTESKLMYTISGAFVPYRNDGSAFFLSGKRKIYVSLNSLFNKEESYTKSMKAEMAYAFNAGDKLRVIDYNDGSKSTAVFNIIDYVTLDDGPENPIYNELNKASKYATTGDFLVIEENEGAVGFTVSDINDDDSNWFKQCLVEIFNNQSKVETNIYYEIGTAYDVTSGAHEDHRTATTLDLTITVSSSGDLEGNTATRIFKGDSIVVGSNTITIGNVYKEGSTYYFYASDKSVTPLGVASYTDATISGTEKVIEITQGDAYFRLRNCFTSVTQINRRNFRTFLVQNSVTRFVESYSVSDFFVSESSSIGRPISYIPDASQVKRKASITYSDYYSVDSSVLNLSSFNLSLANFKDLAVEHGSIKGLVGYNQALYFIQERRCGVLAVNKNIIQTGSGDELVTLSTNILGNERYYSGEYGCGDNPESIAHYNGKVFFADVNSGAVLRVDSSGIFPISSRFMSSFFNDKFNTIANESSHAVIGGVDKDNKEYILSTKEISGEMDAFTLGFSIDSNVWTTFYSFQPESIISLRGKLNTFSGGSLWEHNEDNDRNSFYGVSAATSRIKVISRKSQSAIKTYESISLEGNKPWSAVVTTTDQLASINQSSFKNKEGMYYAYIHGATTTRSGSTNIDTTKSTNEFFGLGVVDSVSNDTITFKNDINSMSFPVGNKSFLYKLNGSELEALSITASSVSGDKKLTCSANVTNVVQDDVIVLVADSSIEGDQIRDYYAQIELNKTDTEPIELFAVNAVITDSKAHN